MLVGAFSLAGWTFCLTRSVPEGLSGKKKESIIFSHFMFKNITLITL